MASCSDTHHWLNFDTAGPVSGDFNDIQQKYRPVSVDPWNMPCQHPLSAKPMLVIEDPFRSWICTTLPMNAFIRPIKWWSGQLRNSCKSWWTVWYVHHPSLICSRLKVKQTWWEEGLALSYDSKGRLWKKDAMLQESSIPSARLLFWCKVVYKYAALSGSWNSSLDILQYQANSWVQNSASVHHALKRVDNWVMTWIVRSMACWKYWWQVAAGWTNLQEM